MQRPEHHPVERVENNESPPHVYERVSRLIRTLNVVLQVHGRSLVPSLPEFHSIPSREFLDEHGLPFHHDLAILAQVLDALSLPHEVMQYENAAAHREESAQHIRDECTAILECEKACVGRPPSLEASIEVLESVVAERSDVGSQDVSHAAAAVLRAIAEVEHTSHDPLIKHASTAVRKHLSELGHHQARYRTLGHARKNVGRKLPENFFQIFLHSHTSQLIERVSASLERIKAIQASLAQRELEAQSVMHIATATAEASFDVVTSTVVENPTTSRALEESLPGTPASVLSPTEEGVLTEVVADLPVVPPTMNPPLRREDPSHTSSHSSPKKSPPVIPAEVVSSQDLLSDNPLKRYEAARAALRSISDSLGTEEHRHLFEESVFQALRVRSETAAPMLQVTNDFCADVQSLVQLEFQALRAMSQNSERFELDGDELMMLGALDSTASNFHATSSDCPRISPDSTRWGSEMIPFHQILQDAYNERQSLYAIFHDDLYRILLYVGHTAAEAQVMRSRREEEITKSSRVTVGRLLDNIDVSRALNPTMPQKPASFVTNYFLERFLLCLTYLLREAQKSEYDLNSREYAICTLDTFLRTLKDRYPSVYNSLLGGNPFTTGGGEPGNPSSSQNHVPQSSLAALGSSSVVAALS